MVSVIAGLFWNLGATLGLTFHLVIRPVGLATLVAMFWAQSKFKWRVSILLVVILMTNGVATLTYALQTNPWYVISDFETQLCLIILYLSETGIALATLFIANRITKKKESNHPSESTR